MRIVVTVVAISALLALSACAGYMKDFDPWGKAAKGNCDRYGNDCQPLCSLYGNCGPASEVRSCELYGNCE